MPKFRCFIRASYIVEAETAEDALDFFEETHRDYGFDWDNYLGVEDCDQDLEPDMDAAEDDD